MTAITRVYLQALAADRGKSHAPRLLFLRRGDDSVSGSCCLPARGVVSVSSDTAEMVDARAGFGGRKSRAALVGSGLVIAILAVLNVADNLVPTGLWLAPLAAAALLGLARWRGLSWAQLGLSRERLRSGALWAAGAIGVVALLYLVGVLLPVSRPAFLDARYHFGVAGALMSALIIIPIGTILLEEVAFRSVLWGMLSRHMVTWRVLVTSSVLFGLWHILPSMHLASANHGVGAAVAGTGASAGLLVVLGTVAFTALGGVVAGELRRRSGSLLASAGMHWATNGLGVLFGLVAWHFVR
jgi:membrane protease YdiL (CAAX protease family)